MVWPKYGRGRTEVGPCPTWRRVRIADGRALGNSFSPCGLAVATATDSMIYKSDVYAASRISSSSDDSSDRTRDRKRTGQWGDKAVLILVGLRLGLDGVNPIYYESIKVGWKETEVMNNADLQSLFTFPQSVGIAGGRPSSSYYFVASQANSLFYLDPHFTRPAIPLEIPPAPSPLPVQTSSPLFEEKEDDMRGRDQRSEQRDEELDEEEGGGVLVEKRNLAYTLDVVDVDDLSDRSVSPSPGPGSKMARGGPSSSRQAKSRARKLNGMSPSKRSDGLPNGSASVDPFIASAQWPSSAPAPSSEPSPKSTPTPTQSSTQAQAPRTQTVPVDPQTLWYANAYPDAALRTFHCEKVKKIPLSGLDPSMLLGFLVTNQSDFSDFCERVATVSLTFSVRFTNTNTSSRIRSFLYKTSRHHGTKTARRVSNQSRNLISRIWGAKQSLPDPWLISPFPVPPPSTSARVRSMMREWTRTQR